MNDAVLSSRWFVYSRLRWVGIMLFILAVPLPLTALYTAYHTDGRWLWLLPCIGTLGLSLGSFGAANDTAIHAAAELLRRGAPPSDAVAELRHEAQVRGARLATVHDSPKAAWVLPLVAVSLGVWMTTRLLSAWSAG